MRTLIRDSIWRLIGLFYQNRNMPLHLREISRRMGLSEGPLTRHLNQLKNAKILDSIKDGNMKKFFIRPKQIPRIFPLFDRERLEGLTAIRRDALRCYLKKTSKKPIFMILFGSTAKGTSKDTSDIDIIEIHNQKTDNRIAARYAETQTGIRISGLQMTFDSFIKELRMKEDHVIQAALETGFPIYNHTYFYEVLQDERA